MALVRHKVLVRPGPRLLEIMRLRILAMLKRAIAVAILRPKLNQKQAVLGLKPLVRANRPLKVLRQEMKLLLKTKIVCQAPATLKLKLLMKPKRSIALPRLQPQAQLTPKIVNQDLRVKAP